MRYLNLILACIHHVSRHLINSHHTSNADALIRRHAQSKSKSKSYSGHSSSGKGKGSSNSHGKASHSQSGYKSNSNSHKKCSVPYSLSADYTPSLIMFDKVNFTDTIDGFVHIQRWSDNDEQKAHCERNVMPFIDRSSYPIHLQQNHEFKECLKLGNAISVRDEHYYAIEHCIGDLLRSIHAANPKYPVPHDTSAPFWKELEHVVDVQILRRADPTALARNAITNLMLPHNWLEFSLADMAEAVRDEPPCYWQAILLRDMLKDVVKYGPLVVDDKIIYWDGGSVEFLHGVILLHDLCMWSVMHVSNYNFGEYCVLLLQYVE